MVTMVRRVCAVCLGVFKGTHHRGPRARGVGVCVCVCVGRPLLVKLLCAFRKGIVERCRKQFALGLCVCVIYLDIDIDTQAHITDKKVIKSGLGVQSSYFYCKGCTLLNSQM